MLNTTLPLLRCPKIQKKKAACGGQFRLESKQILKSKGDASVFEVQSGLLHCQHCKARFPILAGVALLVDEVESYLLGHVKGVSRIVKNAEIAQIFSKAFLAEYREAQEEIQIEHIEEDLESERVTALYWMNHYLKAQEVPRSSPLIAEWVDRYWDQGPLAQVQKWILSEHSMKSVVELGCGVGGLCHKLQGEVSYLGVDDSFVSIALARHFNLGTPFPYELKTPEDLLHGVVSKKVDFQAPGQLQIAKGTPDFIVGNLENPPLVSGHWDACVVLNAIDMLENPARLPEIQAELTQIGGTVIQGCPYVWHERIAKKLRAQFAKEKTSMGLVERLYENAGLPIQERMEHHPWLFFKHSRQIELYSVHLLRAQKKGSSKK